MSAGTLTPLSPVQARELRAVASADELPAGGEWDWRREDALIQLWNAGMLVLDGLQWRITDAGRAWLAAHPEPAA